MITNFRFLNSSVFSAMQTGIHNRSQADLVAEEERDKLKKLDNATALAENNPSLVSDKGTGSGSGKVVLFDDPKTKQRVALRLDENNLQKLKGAFESGDFYERKDGTIRLNGKAESFVSGWFGDIAYKQGYLEADSNKNGVIDEKEKRALRTGAGAMATINGDTIVDEAFFNYMQGGENSFGTIQEAINDILARDKNFDGILERLGEYQDIERAKRDAILAAQMVAFSNSGHIAEDILEEQFSGKWITGFMDKMFKDNKKLADNLKKMMEEYQKQLMERREKGETLESEKTLKELQTQQQALQTLKENGGNLNALNAEERKSLANLTQKENLSEKEMQDLQKQVDTESFNAMSEALGVDKEDLQKVLRSSLDEKNPNDNLLEVDKELLSVIDSIRTQVRNGEVSLLDKMA